MVDWNVKDFSVESKIFVYGYFGMKRNIMLEGGLKFVAGHVYSSPKFQILPMIDLSYFFKLKKKRDIGLFDDDKMY